MVEETKKKETKTSLNVSIDKTQAIIIALVIALGISVYFNMQPTGMVAGDVNDGNNNGGNGGNGDQIVPIESPYDSFNAVSGDICTEDGKPVVQLFSTTVCPHCEWSGETFESVVQEYIDQDLIVAYHWELDIDDDTLTEQEEIGIPPAHMEVYGQFSGGYVPTFVFGCKYYRVGNAFEGEYLSGELSEDMALQKEAELFRQIIDDMLSE